MTDNVICCGTASNFVLSCLRLLIAIFYVICFIWLFCVYCFFSVVSDVMMVCLFGWLLVLCVFLFFCFAFVCYLF